MFCDWISSNFALVENDDDDAIHISFIINYLVCFHPVFDR